MVDLVVDVVVVDGGVVDSVDVVDDVVVVDGGVDDHGDDYYLSDTTNSTAGNAKIAKDAKESIQECVSEFISFITSEVSDWNSCVQAISTR